MWGVWVAAMYLGGRRVLWGLSLAGCGRRHPGLSVRRVTVTALLSMFLFCFLSPFVFLVQGPPLSDGLCVPLFVVRCPGLWRAPRRPARVLVPRSPSLPLVPPTSSIPLPPTVRSPLVVPLSRFPPPLLPLPTSCVPRYGPPAWASALPGARAGRGPPLLSGATATSTWPSSGEQPHGPASAGLVAPLSNSCDRLAQRTWDSL